MPQRKSFGKRRTFLLASAALAAGTDILDKSVPPVAVKALLTNFLRSICLLPLSFFLRSDSAQSAFGTVVQPGAYSADQGFRASAPKRISEKMAVVPFPVGDCVLHIAISRLVPPMKGRGKAAKDGISTGTLGCGGKGNCRQDDKTKNLTHHQFLPGFQWDCILKDTQTAILSPQSSIAAASHRNGNITVSSH